MTRNGTGLGLECAYASCFPTFNFTHKYTLSNTHTHAGNALHHVRLQRSIPREAFVLRRDANKAVGGVQGCFLESPLMFGGLAAASGLCEQLASSPANSVISLERGSSGF